MNTFTIAGRSFSFDRSRVEELMSSLLPDPLREHYVVIGGRRFPPKQVLSEVTGLDRADFTTHQARRILKRLGFAALRVGAPAPPEAPRGEGPYGGRQAAALAPYIGKWVALSDPLTVLVAADTPEEVLDWLARHGKRASYGMFRVPTSAREAGGMAPL